MMAYHPILTTVLLAAMVCLSACVEKTTVRRHLEFGSRMKEAGDIALLPANALVHSHNVSYQTTRQYDYEYYVQARLNEFFSEALQEKNYRTTIISAAELEKHALYSTYETLLEKFKRKASSGTATSNIALENAYQYDKIIDPEAAHIASTLGHNTIGVIFMVEDVKTGGAVARDLALQLALSAIAGGRQSTIGMNEHAILYAAILDGNDGSILWMNRKISSEDLFTAGFKRAARAETDVTDKKLTTLIELLLKKLPSYDELDDAQLNSYHLQAEADASQ